MSSIYDFVWKGLSAHDDFGIEVMAIGSDVIAERRDETQVVPGRSGVLHSQDGAVEEVEKQLAIYLPYSQQGRTVAAMQQIRAWLRGYGALALSNEPGRYRMAYITDQIVLDPIVEGFEDRDGTIIFRIRPYLYHAQAAAVTLTESAIIANPGDAPAAPRITVNGSGDIDLMINDQTVLLNGLAGQIILDCDAQEAYGYDDANPPKLVNLNGSMAGDFPILPTGDILINFALHEDATLDSIIVEPRWRDNA